MAWETITKSPRDSLITPNLLDIDDAVAFAEAVEWESVEGLTKDVYTVTKYMEAKERL